ncbi:hypothetical protein ZIOFF_049613 [Zingiber officinale]|uniref:Uncharacterized protein n=1 Tax=Zingiber officinale TaxID=94328 RepID=A0A8J5KFU4_ZINOF|nr:hypothetical protein ZIOFF_049613 [Zingiber officinale]
MESEGLSHDEHVPLVVPPAFIPEMEDESDFKSYVCEMIKSYVDRQNARYMQYIERKKEQLECISKIEKLKEYGSLKKYHQTKLEKLEKNQMMFREEMNEMKDLMFKTAVIFENMCKDIPRSNFDNDNETTANEEQPEAGNVFKGDNVSEGGEGDAPRRSKRKKKN